MHQTNSKHKLLPNSVYSVLAVTTFLCLPILVHGMQIAEFSSYVRSGIVVFLCYFPVALIFLKKPACFPYDFFLMLAIIILIFYLTLSVHPEYKSSISQEMWQSIVVIYTGIIGYFFIRLPINITSIRRVLVISSVVIFVYYGLQGIKALNIGYWEVINNGQVIRQSYSMSFGYNMLRPSLVFLFYGIREKKLVLLIGGTVGFVSILMLGSRAAAISVLLFILFYFLSFEMKTALPRKRCILIVTFIILVIVLIAMYNPILNSVAGLFTSLGFPSRTIDRMLDGSAIDDVARGALYSKSFELIREGGLFGYGMLADRYYLGTYSHNIFLELVIQFGLFTGIIVSISLTVYVYKMLFKCKDDAWRGVFLIFSCSCIFRLMVSFSFWNDTNFWMMLGIGTSYFVGLKNKDASKANVRKRVVCNTTWEK